MTMRNVDQDPWRERLVEWWTDLGLPHRVNVLLYGAAGIALIALIALMATGGGGDSPRIQVASRGTSTTRPPLTSETTLAPVTLAPLETVTTPAPTPSTVGGSAGVGATVAATPKGGSSKGATATTAKPASKPGPGGPTPTTPLVCRNSTDPRCGAFGWDPPPGENKTLSIQVSVNNPTPRVGDPVTFTVVVTDPDHAVTDNCAQIRFGDGGGEDRPCNKAPCPDAHGPWTTPAKEPGMRTFTYQHTYANDGPMQAKFAYHTEFDRCPDPYGSNGLANFSLTISAPPAQPAALLPLPGT